MREDEIFFPTCSWPFCHGVIIDDVVAIVEVCDLLLVGEYCLRFQHIDYWLLSMT